VELVLLPFDGLRRGEAKVRLHYSNKGLGGTSSSPIVWVLAILGCRRQVSDFISGVGLLPSCVTQDDEHGLAISSLA